MQRQERREGELRRIQAHLAVLGADPSVCEVARVMRLPGFWNRKREPHALVELVSSTATQFLLEEIRAAFPGPSRSRGVPRASIEGCPPMDERLRRARAYAQILAQRAPVLSGSYGHNRTLRAIIKVACGFALEGEESLQVLMNVYNPSCRPPWSPEGLRRKVQEALRVCTKRGWLLEGGRPKAAPGQALPRPSAGTSGKSGPNSIEDPARPCFHPFRLDSEGLWYLQKSRTDEVGTDDEKAMKLSGAFEVLAEVRDAQARG